jgi:hypothetical protein
MMNLVFDRPDPKREVFSVRLSKPDRLAWEAAAASVGVTLAQLVRAATQAAAIELLARDGS